MDILQETVIFLIAAVIIVPIFKHLGFGAVLGYLSAGILIGPFGLNLISDIENILHFAELGVVLLLFIIGLELQPSRLWALRHSIFIWGTLQMTVTTLMFTFIGLWLGYPLILSTLVAYTLSLSSTAFALQMLAERKELAMKHGRTAFAILLFQDIAVVPILALLPLLAVGNNTGTAQLGWKSVLMGILIMIFILSVGRYLLRYFLRLVASIKVNEILTASALLIVAGFAMLFEHIGLSMALGAFLAGVLLADSEYRHQLEADIDPFKGLLLGLFFIAVGMSVNISIIIQFPENIISITATMIITKFIVLFMLGKFQGMQNNSAKSLALSISQGGEFAFVIFASAVNTGILREGISEILIVAVTLSMVMTPLILKIDDLVSSRKQKSKPDFDVPGNVFNKVIIAGFGRFGQITGRLLSAKKIPFTALESNPEQVDFVRRFGNKIFYGDASSLSLLQAANIDKASIFVLAIDDVEASIKIATMVRQHFPHIKIYARARNRQHAYQLMDLGISYFRRETFAAALELAGLVLSGLGISLEEVKQSVKRFRDHDINRLHSHRKYHTDEEKMISLTRAAAKELEELFDSDTFEES